MSTVPEAIIDTLNGLLEGHLNSIFHFVVHGSPYLNEATADLRQLIQEIDRVCKKETQELVSLIESLGGVPRVRNRVAPEEQYLSFLSLKFLLPTLVNEKDLLLTRYENARATIGRDYPQVVETLGRIETEQCIYIEKLKAAASVVTRGKYEPPKHSENAPNAQNDLTRMRVLYVHQNFPAQFGHIAAYLANHLKWECSFVSETPGGVVSGIEKIQYKLAGGATQQNHFCSRTFENTIWHCDAVHQAVKQKSKDGYRPDLIVGHSGFGSTLFLRELYPDVPCINLFEYYYHAHGPDSDMDFRTDLGWVMEPEKYHRARCRNAMILLDLQNCDAAYAPTEFQRSRFPAEYLPKIEVIFDGVDRTVYHGFNETLRPKLADRRPRTICGVPVPAGTRIVTYVSRGFESMRGFDIFMRVAKRVAQEFSNVIFIVVGTDRIAYGGDSSYIGDAKSFRAWVLEREEFDLSRFAFVGQIPPLDLAQLLAATDLHIYLTVPFVLSWSMVNAMSCGAVVLGSATGPVQEMIRDGENGLLADFFDIEGFAAKALAVVKDPDGHRPLGRAAEQMIVGRYSMDATIPKMVDLYERTVNRAISPPPARASNPG